MPLDGIVLRSLCTELNNLLSGGRIEKIFQPEKDKCYNSCPFKSG